ncbi:MAG: hypothetical protein DCC73_11935 [Proteobacteria bacterium]|nr:MAG: hypothetical protein DCC73_11935 [Pseudomonadota bacterium]
MAVYACDVIGTGTDDDPFRPAIDDHLKGWSAVDGRADPTQATGSMLAFCDPSPEEAVVIAGDARIEVIA